MNVSAIPVSGLLGRLFRFPLRFIPASTVLPILQSRARGMSWIVGASDHGFWLGSFEYAKRVRFERSVRPGQTVYDIGAHVGFYTLLSSRLVGPSGRVVAFEPSPRNLDYLTRHVELNRLSNVTIIPAGVGERTGRCRFEVGATNAMGHLSSAGEIDVPVIDVDTFVLSGSAPPPDVIKMDIEGGEFGALRGAVDVINRWRPLIFLATHSEEIHRACLDFLRTSDYLVESITQMPLNGPGEILAWHARSA